MRRYSLAIRMGLGLAALIATLPAGPAGGANAPPVDAALDAIAAYAPQAMREQGTPGLSVAITDRRRTLRIITVGYANGDTGAPVRLRPALRSARLQNP
jgi:CubicO group peptidase (beta-lactamase class C family)